MAICAQPFSISATRSSTRGSVHSADRADHALSFRLIGEAEADASRAESSTRSRHLLPRLRVDRTLEPSTRKTRPVSSRALGGGDVAFVRDALC